MKFLITDYFFKSIPFEKNKKVLNKLHSFYEIIKANKLSKSSTPNGFWVKKIQGCSHLFEFRVDNGDRIFFLSNHSLRGDDPDGNIIFLLYSSHDRAVKKAKRKELSELHLKEFITYDNDDNIILVDEEFFDYNNLITYEIIEDEEFISNFTNKKYKYYYLNDEQFSCLADLPPYFVAGSAGSGKSTITLRKLLNLEENNKIYGYSNILYLTANQYLKENSYEQYLEFRNSDKTISSFFTLKEFLAKNLNISAKNIATFSNFKSFLQFSYPNRKKLNLSIEEIYSEINGIIKGIMIKNRADNWDRDLSSSSITLDDYLNLSSKYSTLNSDSRKILYEITQNYNRWLQDKNLYDLNDLAILLSKKDPLYDFIIIDEVQDLTEVQIYALISLVKNKDNIFLAGDIHQMINSTFFNFERIKNLFYSTFKKRINIKILSKNYRSCKKIVDLANYFSHLRSIYIGNLGSDDYKELSIQKEGEVNLTSINLSLIDDAQNDAHTAIVVPNDSTKKDLLDKLSIKHRVFTIQEIKGLEYNNIICYNLSSKYLVEWKKIFSKEAKHDQKYRKYFNIFYVGITRAQEKLIIMEENIEENPVLKELHDFLTPSNNIIIEKSADSILKEKEDWKKEGIKLYKLEELSEAQYAFEKAGEPTWIIEKDIENDIENLNFKNAILKIDSNDLKGKNSFYRKALIDKAIESNLYFVAAECNKSFGIAYKEKEIKEGIKSGIDQNIFTQKELQKIIHFYKEKKDSNFVGDLLLKMKRFDEALTFYQNLNNTYGIKLARKGILTPNFSYLSNFDKKLDELDEIIVSKNINSFDKKDKLTPLHRALVVKEDPILFDMILHLGGNLSTFVKGKELVPIYCLNNMSLKDNTLNKFLEIFIEHNFNFNNALYLPLFLKRPKTLKTLLEKEKIDYTLFINTINGLIENSKDTPDSNIDKRKLILCKNIIKNYKKKKEKI